MLSLLLAKTQKNPKQFLITLTFELERRSKPNSKVDEIKHFLSHLYGYNSVCLLKPATRLGSPVRLNLGLALALKNTRHLTQTKGRSLD